MQQPESILVYERVLKGERWPTKYVGTETTKDRSIEILRYLFFEKLQIYDYETARATLCREFVSEYRLQKVISPFPKPVELMPDDYDHILWLLFPERTKGKQKRIIKVYMDVLSGKRNSFPRGYFTDPEEGKERARTCFKHLCRKILRLSGDQIAWEFCHSDGIKILAKYHLKILLNHVYRSLSEMIADIYPQYFEQLVIYQVERDKRHEVKTRRKRNGPK